MRLTVLLISVTAAAFSVAGIPKDSAYALGSTRGRPFNSGLVFVNGKYLPPPYVVERWGVGIRINRRDVIDEVVKWESVLKTQDNVRKVESEETVMSPAPGRGAGSGAEGEGEDAPAQSVQEEDEENLEESLDALFDDDDSPKPSRSSAAKAPKKKRRPPPAPKVPRTVKKVEYVLDGGFKHNGSTRSVVSKINEARSNLDRHLRSGGFVFFGDKYARVTGDARSARLLLEKLPDAQRGSETFGEFAAALHDSGLVYFSDLLCADLFRNRIDYRMLQERRKKMENEENVRSILERQ